MLGVTISGLLSDLGYVGLALLMVAETVFPQIPSEVVLPLAGYLVQQGDFTFAGALIASTAGSLIGAIALKEAARHGGRPFAERFVRFAHQDPAKLDDAERWFHRRGWLLVLGGRCVPGVRSLVALPAGVLRMPRRRVHRPDLDRIDDLERGVDRRRLPAGSAMGARLGRRRPISTPLLVIAALATTGLVLRRWLRARRRVPPDEPAADRRRENP